MPIPANHLARIVAVKHAGETLPDLLGRLDLIEGMEVEREVSRAAMAEMDAELQACVDNRIAELEYRAAIREQEEEIRKQERALWREDLAHEQMVKRMYGRRWQNSVLARRTWVEFHKRGLVSSADISRYWDAACRTSRGREGRVYPRLLSRGRESSRAQMKPKELHTRSGCAVLAHPLRFAGLDCA